MSVDIAYIASHGFAARMVMQTDLLGKLVKQGLSVALISPDRSDPVLRKFCEESNVLLYEFRPQGGFLSKQYQKSRRYFLEDIKSNPALFEKHIYETLYNRSKNPWDHIRPRLLYLLYITRQVAPKIKDWYRKREKKALESDSASELLNEIDPGLLVSTYPVNFSEAMLLKSAEYLKIKTVIHLLSWDNITCKGHFPQLSDEYIVWGEVMKEELIEYYNVEEKCIHLCGVPHFDVHIESKRDIKPHKHLKKLGLDTDQPYIFFGMSAPRFTPREIDIVEWLANKINSNAFGKSLQLIIRPHPQIIQGSMADHNWLHRLKKLSGGKVGIDYPEMVDSKLLWSMEREDMIKLSQLIAGSSLTMNSGSTLSIDSLMCDVPVILTSFDGAEDLPFWKSARRLTTYTHIGKMIKLGMVSVASSFDSLEDHIRRILRHKAVDREILHLYNSSVKSKDSSTEMVISTLLRLRD